MRVSRYLYTSSLVMLLASTFVVTGCSQFKRSPERAELTADKSTQVTTEGQASGSVAENILQNTTEPLRVALILGPGGYKTFAHAGVIKELRRRSIPIHAVVGVEWGALVGGLFAQRGQISEAEWKLYKLEKLRLSSGGFFSSKKDPISTQNIRGYLQENFNLIETTQTALKFYCPSLSLRQGILQWQEHGALSRSVMNCMPTPPLLQDQEAAMVAALFAYENIVARLKSEGYQVIILVNVLSEGNFFDNPSNKDDYALTVLWSEARRAIQNARRLVTDVIEVNTRGIDMTDFESRKLLFTAGEASGEKAVRHLQNKYGF